MSHQDNQITMPGSWGLLVRLYRESLHRHIPFLLMSFLAIAVVASMASAYAYMMGPFVDRVLIAHDASKLWMIGGTVILIFFARSAAQYVQEVLLVSLGQRIVLDSQKRLFESVLNQDMSLFDGTVSGELVGRLTYDTNLLRITVTDVFLNVGKDFMSVVTMGALMFYEDWKLAFVCFALVPLAFFPMAHFSAVLRRYTLRVQADIGGLTAILTQIFSGIRVVRSYSLEAAEQDRVDAVADRLARLMTDSVKVEAGIMPVFDFLGAIALAVIILYGGYHVLAHKITPGACLAFATAVYGAYQPLRSLARMNVSLQTGLAAAQRIFALLDRRPQIVDAANPATLPRHAMSVQFDNVSFAYPGRDGKVLNDADFTAAAGGITALVGRAGAGKTTALNLISRLYDVTNGAVRVNNIDVRAIASASLRDSIAVVSQDTVLFDDTIANNIRYARLQATDQEVAAAAQAANAMDFILRLPEGFQTKIGEGGQQLSGGQRQAISIARAILRDAPILLLDEPTSAQDLEGERWIQGALRKLMLGRTTIVIAHRLSTVRYADVIHVLDEGRVVESGSHDDLLARGGLYAQLVAIEFARVLSPVANSH